MSLLIRPPTSASLGNITRVAANSANVPAFGRSRMPSPNIRTIARVAMSMFASRSRKTRSFAGAEESSNRAISW